jgi:metal-dependent hydrolase (beta-lactamase superfamily II)
LYNFIFDVQNVRGESNPFFGKTHTEETKKIISESKKNKYVGSGNPNFGNKYSLDTRISMTLKNSQTKLTPEQVLQIKELLLNGCNHQDIADRFNISRSVITRISNGKRWSNITGGPILPAVYKDGVRVLSDSHKAKIGKGRKGKKHTEEAKNKMRQSRVREK